MTQCLSLHTDTTPPQPNHNVTPTHIEPEQYNPWNNQQISRKLLRMDVLTSETCWALNNEIIKQVTSSWSLFIQLFTNSLFMNELSLENKLLSLSSPAPAFDLLEWCLVRPKTLAVWSLSSRDNGFISTDQSAVLLSDAVRPVPLLVRQWDRIGLLCTAHQKLAIVQ